MINIDRKNVIYNFSKENKSIKNIESGDVIKVQTFDCFKNQLLDDSKALEEIDMSLTNPATGPIYVNNAEVNDVLKVEILDIKVGEVGVIGAIANEGCLGDKFTESKIKRIKVKNNIAYFNEKLSFEIDPMIGVIGVAPSNDVVPTVTPGSHGGNMDCTKIKKGATLYFPVQVEGGLLALGDLHALMGDGEISMCGLEIEGEVTLKVTVIKNKSIEGPMIEVDDKLIVVASSKTVEEAWKKATVDMHNFLVKELKMDVYDAGMLLSMVGNLVICQVVNPLKTVRMELPLSCLRKYNYKICD
ncbi:acetamidase/formamidase family protein [Clostridium ihumii]|uniref:acetamidase/formamidase family protein n=1 Tax=Clostridium ihumii TaxID=1470356 RepID=UPI00058B7279|nr:acetamidase/formamidase family protein [Clostridium ihumii]